MSWTADSFPEPIQPIRRSFINPPTKAERRAIEFTGKETKGERLAKIALTNLINIRRFEQAATEEADGRQLQESGHFDRLIKAGQVMLDEYAAMYGFSSEDVATTAKIQFEALQNENA